MLIGIDDLSILQLDDLITNISKLMIQHNISSLIDQKTSRNEEKSGIWREISYMCFNSYDYGKIEAFKLRCKRNYNNFHSQIIEKKTRLLSNANLETECDMEIDENTNSKPNLIKLFFSTNDWLDIRKRYLTKWKSGLNYRLTFKRGFEQDILTQRIQEQNINCALKGKFNYFAQNEPYKWSGKYECVGCGELYSTSIKGIKGDVIEMDIEHSNQNRCLLKQTYKSNCTGLKRQNEALKVSAIGIQNTLYNNHSKNTEINYDVLKQIKYEFKHKNRISTEVFFDANATKIITDSLIGNDNDKIKGYIQEIGLNPFGFLLISEIQVKVNLN